jgi:hypothetical protein
MGLQTTRPGGIIRKEDVSIAKNYLDDEELETLNRIVKVRQSVTIDWTLPMSTAVSTPTEPLYPSGVFRPAYRDRSRSRGPFPRVHTGPHIRYLGGTRPDNARFVPLPPHEVAARMVALERFLLKPSLWNERKRLIGAVLRSALSRVGLGNAPILFRSSCHLLLLAFSCRDALTSRLKPFGVKGVSATRLRLYRSFYREYEAIQPTPSGELAKSALSSGIQPTPSVELAPTHQTAAELIKSVENLIRRFSLGWSHYFDRHVKLPDELPTIGIVLCHRKNDALVELTLPPDANIFASKYQLYLPSKEELKARLEQITHDLEGGEAI